jgi:hypothetical protein
MSVQITAAMVDQFSSNIQHRMQQEDSRFAGKVRSESQKGKTKFYEQLGTTAAVRRTSRHADTPRVDSAHKRRQCNLNDYDWSDLVDTLDDVKLLIDPASAYAQSATFAFNRAIDGEIISAATGSSYADENGTGSVQAVALPTAQKVAVDFVYSGSTANSGLTLGKMIKAKSILGKAEYPKGSKLFLAVSQQQIDDLLVNVSQVSSADYAAVKALVDGQVNYFMGFEFIKTQELSLDSGTDVRTCFAYVQNGILLATGQAPQGRITERADKNYATQVYMNMSIGATRMQEEMVVQILTDESP